MLSLPLHQNENYRSNKAGNNDPKIKQLYSGQQGSAIGSNHSSINKEINLSSNLNPQVEATFESISDFVFMVNLKGEFIYLNSALEKTLGRTKEELLGKCFINYIKKKDTRSKINNQFNLHLISLCPSQKYKFSFEGKKSNYTQVELILNLNLDHNWLNVPYLTGIARAVKKVSKEDKLFKQLSTVAKYTTNAVFILNKRLQLEWINDSFSDVFGYQLEEVKGKRTGAFLYGERTKKSTIQYIEERLTKNFPVSVELINYHKDGTPKWIQMVMNPVFDDNNQLKNYVCIEQDITEKKKKQAIIKQQHTDILNSLEYATRIQNSLIPSKKELYDVSQDSFALYMPKDIVSGDFYMAEKVSIADNQSVDIYAVADCTGHGVPGAMLSVLCSSILKEAVRDKNINEPSRALDFAKNKLTTFFNNSNGKAMYDGMDVSMCAIIPDRKLIQFAGANLPLYLIRKGEIEVIKGDRQSIGFSRSTKPFTTHTLKYMKGDLIYMFSDGVIDQFGGDKNKKFMSRRLKELLLSIHDQPMDQQRNRIRQEILKWKGKNEQTDDICIMGRRL